MIAIPINRQNITLLASGLGVSTEELVEQVNQSEIDHKKKQDMKYILNFFNTNETWYKKTKEEVKKIAASLPEDIDYKDRTIKMYGWIENETKISGNLNIPMEFNKRYSAASAIEMVFNGQIDLYRKIMNWD